MAASAPWETQTATACEAAIRASSTTGRSDGLEAAEDEVGRVDRAALADPQAEAGVAVGPELGGDVAESFLAAVGAIRAGCGASPGVGSGRRRSPGGRSPGRACRTGVAWRTDRPLRFMNVSGLSSRTRRKSISSLGELSPSNFRLEARPRAPLGQPVDGLESDVVPRPVVLAAGVAPGRRSSFRMVGSRRSRSVAAVDPRGDRPATWPRPTNGDQLLLLLLVLVLGLAPDDLRLGGRPPPAAGSVEARGWSRGRWSGRDRPRWSPLRAASGP